MYASYANAIISYIIAIIHTEAISHKAPGEDTFTQTEVKDRQKSY